MKERGMSGTGVLCGRVSRDTFVISTPAHNFVQFEENMGKRIKKYADEAIFYLQCDGQKYLFKFDLNKFFLHKNYKENGFLIGTDIALAAITIDRSDPGFDEEKFGQIEIPEIELIKS